MDQSGYFPPVTYGPAEFKRLILRQVNVLLAEVILLLLIERTTS